MQPDPGISSRPPTDAPAADVQLAQRQVALGHLVSALRQGQAQLQQTSEALSSIVHDLAQSDLTPLSGRCWELLARRLRSEGAAALHGQLRALFSLQQANDNVQQAIGLMGHDRQMASEQACRMAEATVRQHLAACTQRLTLIAQMVRQVHPLPAAATAQAAA